MQRTVLMAKEDWHTNQVVGEYCEDAGYRCLTVENGGDALEIISQGAAVDLFVFDLLLPGPGGLELLHVVRESEQHGSTPVVLLTALGDSAVGLLKDGHLADAYLPKPFSPRELVQSMPGLFQRGEPGSEPIQLGRLTVDRERGAALWAGREILLTLREYQLVLALATHPNQAIGRLELLELAWGKGYFSESRIVDIHLLNICRKLPELPVAGRDGRFALLMQQESSMAR